MRGQIVIRGINFLQQWRSHHRWISKLFSALNHAGAGRGLYELQLPGGKKVPTPVDMAEVETRLLSGKIGSYIMRSKNQDKEVIDLYDYGLRLNIYIDYDLGEGDEKSLRTMIQLASEINLSVKGIGAIGPIFWLALPTVQYPRPQPPRYSPHWQPGVVIYFLSQVYYASGTEAVEPPTFDKVAHANLPKGLIRRQLGDLLVIQAIDQLTEDKMLQRNLYTLERWVGETLNLPIHEDFAQNGDQLWRVWKSERIKPYSFYDESTRIAYKVVAEDADNKLDSETLSELQSALIMRKLPDGRPIVSTMVIFAFREGAIANLQRVCDLGGAGVLYRDKEGAFWNPSPPGNWIREQ